MKLINTVSIFLNITLLFLLAMLFLSPILWVWYGWNLFWRIFLTSLILFLTFQIFKKGLKYAETEYKKEQLLK